MNDPCFIKGKTCTDESWHTCPFAEYCASTYGMKEVEERYKKILNDSKLSDEQKLVRLENWYTVYNVCAVEFKRDEGGKWEPGIGFNEGELLIVDRYGKPVTNPYDYRKHTNMFSVDVSSYLKRLDYLINRKPLPVLHEG